MIRLKRGFGIKKHLLVIIILFSFLIYLPSLVNFFSSDDWFFLKISQITNLQDFFNFFSFSLNDQSAPFYRPISTQLFYFISQILFGLNPFFFHILTLILFGTSSYLVFRLVKILTKKNDVALASVFFYSFSAIHFNSLYFLAAAQELFLAVFGLLSLIFFIEKTDFKKTILSMAFFILALGSKESAVIIPFLLLVYLLINKQKVKTYVRLIPFFLILLIYSALWATHFNSGISNSYHFDFSLNKLFNTTLWYYLWSLGVPELLVDYIGSGFKVVPRFFSDFPIWSWIVLAELGLMLVVFVLVFVRNFKKIGKAGLFSLFIIVLSLSPVIFFPWHKYPYYLAVPIVGFSIILAQLLANEKNKMLKFLFLGIYLILNLSTIILSSQTHYSISRAKISEQVYTYFKANYLAKPKDSYFEFINDSQKVSVDWGSSKQIAVAVADSNLFEVLYKDPNFKVYYQDYPQEIRPTVKQKIDISSIQFLLNKR